VSRFGISAVVLMQVLCYYRRLNGEWVRTASQRASRLGKAKRPSGG
jgi:hypothetical protein